MIMDVRIEIEGLHDFKELKKLIEGLYYDRKIYEISLLNVD